MLWYIFQQAWKQTNRKDAMCPLNPNAKYEWSEQNSYIDIIYSVLGWEGMLATTW